MRDEIARKCNKFSSTRNLLNDSIQTMSKFINSIEWNTLKIDKKLLDSMDMLIPCILISAQSMQQLDLILTKVQLYFLQIPQK